MEDKPKSGGRKKNIFRIIAIFVIAGLIAGSFGLYEFYKPQSRVTSADPDVTISAAQLYNIFNQNADSASKALKDKIVQVKGEVGDIQNDKGGNTNISLQLGPEAMAAIKGEFAPEAKNDLKGLKTGDEISFKGTVNKQEDLMGIPGDIIIKHATLVKEN
jgi:hypothetical protein